MKWTSLNDLREKYLAFFESKGHLRLPSYPLIPHNDKSLLLINSGMAPMKKYFTGEEIPPRNRVCTCQKCIRTPDLERVGHTARHGTYFEMLGNFSFGDYFKDEAIPWAWEFCTEVVKMDPDRIYCSVYLDDDEAYDIWTKDVKEWFDNPVNGYKEGYSLDKDILVKGNKIYSPETCCFVPQDVNILFTKRTSLVFWFSNH